mgnify:CR=1 FL=1
MRIRSLILFPVLVLLMSGGTWAGSTETADLLLINGKIITVDAAFSIRSGLAVKGDRILAVGSEESLSRYRGDGTRVIDLHGKAVMPGLIDSHAHPAGAAVTEFDHPIPTMESIPDVLNYIRSRAAVLKEGQWIWVSQVFLTRLKEERYPTRDELDAAAPKNPAVFQTGPDASVNSLALQASGIGKGWKVDDGGPGYAETDPNTGEPTGILRSCTRYIKYESPLKKPTGEQHLAKLRELFADYNRVGIVGVGERDADEGEIQLYQKMLDQGDLTVRAYLSQHVDTIQPVEKIRAAIAAVAQSPLYQGNGMLRVRAMKVYMDGGMLTGSAFMREPWGVSKVYNISDPLYRGLRFIPEEKFLPLVEACLQNRVQFTSHSVGDGAVHAIIDGFAAFKDRFDIRDQRPVIGHSNFMSAEAVRRVAELGMCADIQPAWLYLDGRTLTNHFGYDRLAWFQPLHALFAAGAMAGGGSDHMQKIGSMKSNNFYDPWMGMYVAMTRQAKWTEKPLHPEQALSRVEAIRFYTINNAYLFFAEEERGSLETGKLADFIILDNDPLACPIEEFKDIKVLETYLGGKKVYAQS